MTGFNAGTFLIQFLIIVGGAALARRAMRALRQPPLLGELLLGLLLGPSLLGWAWPEAEAVFFPEENRPLLEALAWIGIILFIYSVGSELEWTRSEARPIFFVAMGGLIVPFVLGSVLALRAPSWFFPGAPSFEGMIVLGIVMSVSAIPVLGRLLRETGLAGSRLANISLGASTIDDLVGWSVLGLVAGSGAVGLFGDTNLNLLLVAALFAAAIVADRYLSPLFTRHAGEHNPTLFVWLLIAIFAAALLTHEAGLHAILGPFAVGAVVSRHPVIREYARTRMDEITSVLFLPAFFVLAGFGIDLTVLEFPAGLWILLVVVAVATVSKIVGAYIGARAGGLDPRTGLQAGILINIRGAIGLVVARVGWEAGLFSQTGYTILVLMIACTTILSPMFMGLLARTGKTSAARPPTAAP